MIKALIIIFAVLIIIGLIITILSVLSIRYIERNTLTTFDRKINEQKLKIRNDKTNNKR